MRILQVCPGVYASGRGGISEHVMRISEGLARRGHDVTVFATNHGELAWFEVVHGVKVRRFRRFAPGGSYFLSPSMFWALLRVKGFDVVHAHGFHAFPMHFASLAKCKRFVVTTHFHGAGHTVFRDCLFRLSERVGKWTLLRAYVVVAVSDYERRLLLDRFKLDQRKVVIVPNGVDFKEFEGLTRRNRGFRSILYVGRLEAYKGVHYLIEALPKLPSDVVLEIVGRGSLKGHLERRAWELGVSDRVRFYQDLPKRDLLQLIVDAEVFILLSRFEAYSLVVAEALTAGTPCIVANTSALTEWVDGRSCFGVDVPVKLSELVSLIEGVLDGKMGRDASSCNVRAKIIGWDEVAGLLERVYAG